MYQFRKSERLYNYKLKSILFRKGYHFKCFPFKVFWYSLSGESYKHKNTPAVWSSGHINKIEAGGINYYDICGKKLPQSAVFYYPAKTIFSVSAKIIKKASARNYIRRLMKESYRKNKSSLYSFLEKEKLNCLIAFSYIGKQKPDQKEIEKKLVVSLQYLIKEIKNNKVKK